jgi:sulfite dehydrogenase
MRPIGQKGDPSQPSLWRMNVNSWIHGPGAAGFVRPGTTVFHGVAFSGERAIVKVEGSTDGGKTWKPARLVGPDLGANAWRQFAFEAQLEPGKYMVVSRATDQAGEVQPAERLENERGYANNSWRDHGLAIEATTAIPDALEEPVPPQTSAKGPRVLSDAGTRGHGEFLRADPPCGGCHTLEHAGVAMPIGPDLDQLAPTRERVLSALRQGVGAMPTYKGKLTDAQLEDLATYVVEATKRGT